MKNSCFIRITSANQKCQRCTWTALNLVYFIVSFRPQCWECWEVHTWGAHLEQLKVREIRRNRSNHNVISLGESQGIAKSTCDPEGRVPAHLRVLWLVAGICAGRKH